MAHAMTNSRFAPAAVEATFDVPVVGRLAGLVAFWRRRARERAELAEYSDRELRDIGLSRSDANFEVNKPFWRA